MSYAFGRLIGGILSYGILVGLGLWLWYLPSPWSFSVFLVYTVGLIQHDPDWATRDEPLREALREIRDEARRRGDYLLDEIRGQHPPVEDDDPPG